MVFVAVEDETGTINIVVWAGVGECFRGPLMDARLLTVFGHFESDGNVHHVSRSICGTTRRYLANWRPEAGISDDSTPDVYNSNRLHFSALSMPAGLPTREQLLAKEITFFSLDTNVFDGAGFRISSGPLTGLSVQIPLWISLQLSDVVAQEVIAHRMEKVMEKVHEVRGATGRIGRLAELDMSTVEKAFAAVFNEANVLEGFKEELKEFVEELRGAVLPVAGEAALTEIFRRYFALEAPFEEKKKSEFPDAAALVGLESYARDNGTKGILVSDDKGWKAYAAATDNLYCAGKLTDLTDLFTSGDMHVEMIDGQIKRVLRDSDSAQYQELKHSLESHLRNAEWDVEDIYTGSSARVEASAWLSSVEDVVLDLDGLEAWFPEKEDLEECVVRIAAKVQTKVSVEYSFYIWDSIDHDEVPMRGKTVDFDHEVEVEIHLRCTGEILTTPIDEWSIEYEFTEDSFGVEVGQVDIDYSGDEDE